MEKELVRSEIAFKARDEKFNVIIENSVPPVIKFANDSITEFRIFPKTANLLNAILTLKEIEEIKRKYVTTPTIGSYSWENINTVRNSVSDMVTDEVPFISVTSKSNYIRQQKELYDLAADKIGISISAFRKVINAIIHKTFVLCHNQEFVCKFCITNNSKQLMPRNLNKLFYVGTKLKQLKDDGLWHIAPFVFAYERNPQELKELFGKNKWKVLTKNTFSRNKKIVKFINNYSIEIKRDLEKEHLELPSSIYEQVVKSFGIGSEFEIMKWIKNNAKGHWSDQRKYHLVAREYQDTKRLAETNNLLFNTNWSLDEMKAKHTEYIAINNARPRVVPVYPWSKTRDIIDPLKEFPLYSLHEKFHKVKSENFEAIMLKNADEVETEGKAMHHCVSVYSGNCHKNQYLIWSVKFNGERYATLGVKVTEDEKQYYYTYDQCYSFCNKPIHSDCEEFVKEIFRNLCRTKNAVQPLTSNESGVKVPVLDLQLI